MPCHNCSAHSPTEREESEEGSDEVEELRVDSDMERNKDAVYEAEREEGESLISPKVFFLQITHWPQARGVETTMTTAPTTPSPCP